ncbi:MAG: hypothetical protein KKD66_13420 [Proteobacteria bacterium]|nr:hypothetical protein [Pseudomonadota bacterium]MBU2456171.1 hypothetical protein [Pseudomonadota bacterium]
MKAKSLADKWRIENGHSDKGGVIIIFRDEGQGWVNELCDPQAWQPISG